jgi:hypothetical protein
MIKRFAAVTVISLLCGWILIADDKIDSSFNWKIRQEEIENSQVMLLVHQLTDVYGPRRPDPQFQSGVRLVHATDESVGECSMMGAHLDSWHAGTGATDNATGVAAIIQAARILLKLEVESRRTIRVALWGGEGAPGIQGI